MTPRSLRFRMCAVLLAALAISSLGCAKAKPAGELVGVYAIAGALVENTCGQSALPTQNPLAFNVEVREAEGVGTWQLEKKPAFSGLLKADGEFLFQSQGAFPVALPKVKRAPEPSDFFAGDSDSDLNRATCTLLITESMKGALHRSMQTLDGGIGDAGTDTADLTGKNTIEVAPAGGSDCSSLLAALGGTYLALPCSAHYTIEGSLQEGGE